MVVSNRGVGAAEGCAPIGNVAGPECFELSKGEQRGTHVEHMLSKWCINKIVVNVGLKPEKY